MELRYAALGDGVNGVIKRIVGLEIVAMTDKDSGTQADNSTKVRSSKG